MLIKMFNNSGNPFVENIDVEAMTPWYVDGKSILFTAGLEYKKVNFKSEEKAQEAFERIFETAGASAPFNKTLDLTAERMEIEEEETNNEEAVAKVEVDDSGTDNSSSNGDVSKQTDGEVEE